MGYGLWCMVNGVWFMDYIFFISIYYIPYAINHTHMPEPISLSFQRSAFSVKP
jgi:hypothetical protein